RAVHRLPQGTSAARVPRRRRDPVAGRQLRHLAGDAGCIDHGAAPRRRDADAVGRPRAHRGSSVGGLIVALGAEWAVRWVREAAADITANRAELIELDRQIGDGDHGENMHRGFSTVVSKLDALEEPLATVADVLTLVATTLMSTVG